MSKLLYVGLMLVLLIFVLIGLSHNQLGSRDLIDRIPEYQLVKAAAVSSSYNSGTDELIENCPRDLDPNAIPDLFLADQNGQLRSDEELRDLHFKATCLMTDLEQNRTGNSVEATSVQYQIDQLSVLSGNVVTFPNGEIIDGAKQTFRIAAMHWLPSTLASDTHFIKSIPREVRDELPLGAKPCEALIDNVRSGATLELRWVSFAALDGLADWARRNNEPHTCSQISIDSDGDLLSEAQNGDLSAALQLTASWIAPFRARFTDSSFSDQDLALVQSQIEELKAALLEQAERYPLASLALSSALSTLMWHEKMIHARQAYEACIQAGDCPNTTDRDRTQPDRSRPHQNGRNILSGS